MMLVDVYEISCDIVLYQLLKERPASINISHREMPSWEEHQKFVKSRPYAAWYLIMKDRQDILGSIYLTPDDEIGIFLFKKDRNKGYGQQAFQILMEMHPRKRYLANISPGNKQSVKMFENLGFRHIQNTYALDA